MFTHDIGTDDHDARLYYWYHRPLEDWPPPHVESPGDLREDGRLSVFWTPGGRSAYEQRKLVDLWCEQLPKLVGVRHLWLSSRVPQKLFDAACRVPGLESLYIKWSGFKNLQALEHAGSLRYLHLGSGTGIESIEPLRSMRRLSWLGLEALTRVQSLEPISNLIDLVGLTVEGSMWTTQKVETLAPIGSLLNLRYLSLTNLRSMDRTLAPLFTLRKLQVFHAAQWWSPAERAELERLNPQLR